MSITKNHQSSADLRRLAALAFPGRDIRCITELTEGYFNAAYRFDFTDGSASILKVASASSQGLLSNEINLMQAEISAMQIARDHGMPHVAQVQYSDMSRQSCSGAFFFMEALPGRSMNSCRSELSDEQTADLMRQTGRYQRRLSGITGEKFGLLGDTRRFDALHDLILLLFTNVLGDAQARSIALPVSAQDILALLRADRVLFDEVTRPSLIHWDMWPGNILVQEGRITGIIDWERAMWGEPLMDDRFRRLSQRDFLEGYGQADFTPAQRRRVRWYDLFLDLTMYVEAFYRAYDDLDGHLAWLTPRLQACWTVLQEG